MEVILVLFNAPSPPVNFLFSSRMWVFRMWWDLARGLGEFDGHCRRDWIWISPQNTRQTHGVRQSAESPQLLRDTCAGFHARTIPMVSPNRVKWHSCREDVQTFCLFDPLNMSTTAWAHWLTTSPQHQLSTSSFNNNT